MLSTAICRYLTFSVTQILLDCRVLWICETQLPIFNCSFFNFTRNVPYDFFSVFNWFVLDLSVTTFTSTHSYINYEFTKFFSYLLLQKNRKPYLNLRESGIALIFIYNWLLILFHVFETLMRKSHHPHNIQIQSTSFSMLQIFIWRPCKTRATHSTKPWGWEAWGPCNVACMLAAAPTASPGPHITETADLRKVWSEIRAVFGPRCRDESPLPELALCKQMPVGQACVHRDASRVLRYTVITY